MNNFVLSIIFFISIFKFQESIGSEEWGGYGNYEEMMSEMSSDQRVWTNGLKNGFSGLFCNGFPSPGVSPSNVRNATQYSMNVCSKNSIIQSIVTDYNYTTPFSCNGLLATVLPWSIIATFNNGSTSTLTIPAMYSRYALLNGNWIIVQSGKINGTDCNGSIYVEVSILIPSDQYKCVTTGVDKLYFLYKLILVSDKYQSYCYIDWNYQREMRGNTLIPAYTIEMD